MTLSLSTFRKIVLVLAWLSPLFAALIRRGGGVASIRRSLLSEPPDLGVATSPAVTVDPAPVVNAGPAVPVDPHEGPTVRSPVGVTDPYATLAATSGPGGPGHGGDEARRGGRPD